MLFLTLYPFEFSSHGKPHRGISPLLLGYGSKTGALDVVLNILLFMPFGFALGSKLLKRKDWKYTLLLTAMAGALFSYAIELSQLYIPQRDSGWEDVFTNTTGAVAGFLMCSVLGAWLFRLLSRWQHFLQVWLTPRRLALVLGVYFGVWFFASLSLNRETRLDDWNSDCFLVIGSRSTRRHRWGGQLSKLEMWNRALPETTAERLTRGGLAESADDPLVSFDFQEAPPRQDNNAQLFVSLVPSSTEMPNAAGNEDEFQGSSARPVADLIDRLKRANQFSIRAVLKPAEGAAFNGRIVSLSQPSGFLDLYLGQNSENLVFLFRNETFARRHTLVWKIPDVLASDRAHDVLFSYDGSDVRFYADGEELQSHALGPGTVLASRFRYPKQVELNGYRDIYYTLMFFPAGALLGIALAGPFWRWFDVAALGALDALLAPVLFEWILMHQSQSTFSFVNVCLSAGLVILGVLWVRTDRVFIQGGADAFG
jgi:hypothetical protein